MRLPDLYETPQQAIPTTTFLGLNQNTVVADGEMNDMRNLSGRSYPMLDQRPARKFLKYADSATAPISGMVGGDSLVFCRGTKVYMNGTEVTGLTVSSASPKQLIRMGAYVLIFPDKVWFNTVDLTKKGSLERPFKSLSFVRPAKMAAIFDGDVEGGYSIENPHPVGDGDTLENPTSGALQWYTADNIQYTKIYLGGAWRNVNNPRTKITLDTVDPSDDSITKMQAGETIILDNIRGSSSFISAHSAQATLLATLTGSHLIKKVETIDVFETVQGRTQTTIVIDKAFYGNASTSDVLYDEVKMFYPTPDYIMSTGNRLWMCRYKDEDGQVLNEIRASRLGSMFQWDIFEGLSTDGYAMTAGSDGPFSGCAVLKGQPIFFKENCIHRIAGSQPSNFQDVTTMCRGIQEGCWRSAVVVDERLYYKAVDDVMVYDGSIPVSISEKINMRQFYGARAGAFENLYYLSMRNYAGGWNFFTYSTKTGLWHQQDTFRGRFFATAGRNLYSISDSTNRFILHGSIQADDVFNAITADQTDPEVTDEEPQDWSATFGLFGVDYTNQKYLSRFNIRVQLDQGAWLKMEVQYDEDGIWIDEGTYWGRSMNTIMIPVVPRRCDRFQLRLSGGNGRCRIFSITRMFEDGADG